ncbi:MAG: response regulator [Dehalococcoidia bacterium]
MADGELKGTVMVVDDDESLRDIVARALRDEGYQVVKAMDGQDALDLIARRKFDLVFLDIRMPGFHGQDVLTLIKSTKPEIPVVMLTAVTEQESEDEAIRRGANAYLRKPCNLEDIVKVAREFLDSGGPAVESAGETRP